MNVKTTEKLHC